jgi:hypothetical protein
VTDFDDELRRGVVAVRFVELGEGYDGDYDPADPRDVELLRFDVLRYDPTTMAYEAVDDGSYCTRVPVDTDPITRRLLLTKLLDTVHDRVCDGRSIKKPCEDASWMVPEWVE